MSYPFQHGTWLLTQIHQHMFQAQLAIQFNVLERKDKSVELKTVRESLLRHLVSSCRTITPFQFGYNAESLRAIMTEKAAFHIWWDYFFLLFLVTIGRRKSQSQPDTDVWSVILLSTLPALLLCCLAVKYLCWFLFVPPQLQMNRCCSPVRPRPPPPSGSSLLCVVIRLLRACTYLWLNRRRAMKDHCATHFVY